VIVRFARSDPDVVPALQRALASMPRLVLVTQVAEARGPPIEQRTPFQELSACCGDWLDFLVLLDDGRSGGMWRDPMRELLEWLFQDAATASSAVGGYALVRAGRPVTWFRRQLFDPLEDAVSISQYLATLVPGLRVFERPRKVYSPPSAARRPSPARPTAAPLALGDPEADEVTPTIRQAGAPAAASPAPPPAPPDPYRVLGISPGATFEDARKAWRARIQQYHPDKVAQLAPEFRALAEEKTRELNDALAALARALGR